MSIFQNTMLAGSATQFFPYEIDQSIRFNDDDSAHMNRIFGAGGTPKTFTTGCWFKVASFGDVRGIINSEDNSGSALDDFIIRLSAADKLEVIYKTTANTQKIYWTSDFVLRDPAAWYFVAVTCDTTPATPIFKVFCNASGTSNWDCDSVMTKTTDSLAQNDESSFLRNSNEAHIGAFYNAGAGSYFDGYMAEIFIQDGVVITDPFTDGYVEIDEDGVYKPLDLSGKTFGTQGGLYLGSNSADLGEDSSGNGNDFTSSGLAAADQMPDTPTNNFCTWNPTEPSSKTNMSLQDGNLVANGFDSAQRGTIFVSSGKWYAELTISAAMSAYFGISEDTANMTGNPSLDNLDGYLYYSFNGQKIDQAGSGSAYGSSWRVAGKTVGVAVDMDNGAIWFSVDGVWQNSATISEIENGTTTNAAFTGISGNFALVYSNGTAGLGTLNTGQSSFSYTQPTGFNAWSIANLPDPTIALPEKYFNTVLYEGNGGGQRVGGFQPITETYTVPNSVIFNDDDSAFLYRTPSSTSNRKTYTVSLWFKIGNVGKEPAFFIAGDYPGGSSPLFTGLNLTNAAAASPTLQFAEYPGGASYTWQVATNAIFKDPSKWYHFVGAVDTTQATASDRVKLYVDGVLQTSLRASSYPSLNHDTHINSNSYVHRIGRYGVTSFYADGYMADFYFIDGQQLGPDSFGQLDASTNKWIPKDASGLTFGTNGFYLDMETAPGTGSGAGTDSSGNGNNFTETGLAATDQVTDSPTKNFCVLNPNDSYGSGLTLSDGNLRAVPSAAAYCNNHGTIYVGSGKWVYEVKHTTVFGEAVGWSPLGETINGSSQRGWFMFTDGRAYINTTNQGTLGTSLSSGDYRYIFYDADKKAMWFAHCDVSSGTPTTLVYENGATKSEIEDGDTSNAVFTGIDPVDLAPGIWMDTSGVLETNFGQSSFYTTSTLPTGFNTLNNDNLPLSNGDLSAFVWIKNRDAADNHMLFDAVRGVTKDLHSNSTAAEVTNANTLTRFLKNGFEVSNDAEVNTSGESYAAWQWLNDSLSTSSNTDGTVTSTVNANTTSGFSIAKWTHTTASNYTVGHGLGAVPKMILVKTTDQATNWGVYHSDLTVGNRLILNSTGAQVAGYWGANSWTSSTFSIGSARDADGSTMIGYSFAEVDGFSKFGSYTGNGSTDGPFIYTGFMPEFILIKSSSNSGTNWDMLDATREPFNDRGNQFEANTSDAEANNDHNCDFLSNGFKWRDASGSNNGSGYTIIYMAFARSPFKTALAQ